MCAQLADFKVYLINVRYFVHRFKSATNSATSLKGLF